MTLRIDPNERDRKMSNIPLWWKLPEGEKHNAVFDILEVLEREDADRFKRNVQGIRLYGNVDINGYFPGQYTNILSPALPEARVKYNIISSTTDTVTSKIGKMKPRITYLTSGGRWDEQYRSQKLTKWTDGIFEENGIYRLHQHMFRDGCVTDAGCLYHYIHDGDIKTERVLSTEIFVDKLDAMYGNPTHLYRRKYMRREDLKDMFKGDTVALEAIDRAKGYYQDSLRADDKLDTHVAIVEAWHLKSSKSADDGRRVIVIENHTLVDEEYTKPYFPFTFFHWAPPIVGFWGQSLADRLTGNQLEVNKMLRIIQKSFHLGSAFKVFLEYGSKVAKEHLNNEIGSIVYYNGTKPEFYVPQTVHPEFFQFLEWLIQSSYEEAGISQLSAASRKPAELESGRALREFNLIETERFATVAQAYEDTFLTTAEIYLDLANELYKEDKVDTTMTVSTRRLVESIKWSEVAVERKDYIMRKFPTSMLPSEPAGRIATIEGWINAGLIDPDEGKRLLDFPDIEAAQSLKTASTDIIHMMIEKMLYRGEYYPPEPFMDLAKAIPTMQDAEQKALLDEAPEERIDLLRDWIEQARAMVQKAQEAQMAQQAQIQAQAQAGAQPQQAPVATQNTPNPSLG
jgi:hypothetical protein